jgi:hypothetical protein
VDGLDGRVFIRIREVLGHVLYHEFVGVGIHIGVDEAGKVEVGFAIEIQLVVDELVDGVRGGAILGDGELGDLGPCLVTGGVYVVLDVVVGVGTVLERMLLERGDKLIRVDLRCVSTLTLN